MEFLKKYEEELGSQVTAIREQEIRETRSKIAKIEERTSLS